MDEKGGGFVQSREWTPSNEVCLREQDFSQHKTCLNGHVRCRRPGSERRACYRTLGTAATRWPQEDREESQMQAFAFLATVFGSGLALWRTFAVEHRMGFVDERIVHLDRDVKSLLEAREGDEANLTSAN